GERMGRGDRAFVWRIGTTMSDEMRDLAGTAQRGRRFGEFATVEEHARRRIADDEFELRHREAPIERDEDCGEPAGSKLDLKDVRGVVEQRGDALAAAHAADLAEMTGETSDALVEGCVCEAPAGGEIDGCHPVGAPVRVMADPIVMAGHRHSVLPRIA